MQAIDELAIFPRQLRDLVRCQVALCDFTTWKIGGPARYLAEPDMEQVPEIIDYARRADLKIAVLGRGSNVLVSDDGFDGLVILTRNGLTGINMRDGCILAQSGVSLPLLSRFAARHGYTGFEFLAGIPGTVGGGIVMNAGLTVFRPKEIRDVVVDFDVLNLSSGFISTLTMEDAATGYRRTNLQDGQRFVLAARFRLGERGDPRAIHEATLAHLKDRKRKQPLSLPTAGSTFKSPPEGESAGSIIEQCGLKGVRVGGARVSELHANWLENTGEATALDIRQLMDTIEKAVSERFGVTLAHEVSFLGSFPQRTSLVE